MAPTPPFGLLFATFSAEVTHPLDRRTGKAASLVPRALKKASDYNPGGGVVDPFAINNNVVFALFGLLGAGIVLTTIWFFFWAKNGGFHFRKGDWDDYKTTVLRRKGPNGTTLSGATKTTDLGGGSVVGSQGSVSDFADPEKGAGPALGARKGKQKEQKKRQHDDVRAYRHEKAARVGGLNREPDGAYHSHAPSDMSSMGGARPTHKAGAGRQTIKPVKPSNPLGRQYSFSAGTEAGFSTTSEDSHRPLNTARQQYRHSHQPATGGGTRHPTGPQRGSGAPQRSRHSAQASMPGSFADPLDFDSRYDGSETGSTQMRETKAYFHPIPGLAGPSRGFRRGMGGDRDDLSDA